MKRVIDIENTVIFQKTRSVYVSIRLIRLLILLDQCHDFLETAERNAWKNKQSEVHQELLNRYFEDVQWIMSTDLYDITPLSPLQKFENLFKELETKARVLSNVSSTRNIKDKFIYGIQNAVGIYNVNLEQDLGTWDCTSFSDNLLTLLNPSRTANNVLVGVDATKASANFSPLFTNICKILYSPEINLKVFNSSATIYDASGASSVTNQIINMAKQRGRTDIVTGVSPTENSSYSLTYKDKKTNKRYNFFEINYFRSLRDNSIVLYINDFFGKKIVQPTRTPMISSNNNSVKFLTTNYEPIDNIFLFKTFGDLGQIFSFAHESISRQDFTNIFITFDFMAAIMSSMFIKSTLLEDVNNYINGLSIFTLNPSIVEFARRRGQGVRDIATAQVMLDMSSYKPNKRAREAGFGKNIQTLTLKTLKDKLKSVGIKVTKTVQGKRIQLSRKELDNKAKAFKKLQIKAKEKGIKLKTKSGNFKSKDSLDKELSKYTKPRKSKFG